MGSTIKGKKLYTIPKITAELVYKILRRGNLSADKSTLINPFRSKSVNHAYVRSKKFIHMGTTKSSINALLRVNALPTIIIAAGYPKRRQIIVLSTAR